MYTIFLFFYIVLFWEKMFYLKIYCVSISDYTYDPLPSFVSLCNLISCNIKLTHIISYWKASIGWNFFAIYTNLKLSYIKNNTLLKICKFLTRLLTHLMFSWEDILTFNWIYDTVKKHTVWKSSLKWHITFCTGGVKEEKLIIFAKFCGNTFLLILMAHIIYFSFQTFEPIQGLRIFQHSANKPIHA